MEPSSSNQPPPLAGHKRTKPADSDNESQSETIPEIQSRASLEKENAQLRADAVKKDETISKQCQNISNLTQNLTKLTQSLASMSGSLANLTTKLNSEDTKGHQLEAMTQTNQALTAQICKMQVTPPPPTQWKKIGSTPEDPTITLHQVDRSKVVYQDLTHKELTIKLNQAYIQKDDEMDVGTTNETEGPFRGVDILRSKDVRVYLKEEVDVQEILKRNPTEWVPNGLRLGVPLYGITVFRVPTTCTPEEFQKHIEDNNGENKQKLKPSLKNQILHTRWIRRDVSNRPEAAIQAQLRDPHVANYYIQHGINYEGRILRCAISNKRLIQCQKCGNYDHTTLRCTSIQDRCLICAQGHTTANCNARCPEQTNKCEDVLKCSHRASCIHCHEKHPSFSSQCNIRKEKIKEANSKNAKRNPLFPVNVTNTNFPPLSQNINNE